MIAEYTKESKAASERLDKKWANLSGEVVEVKEAPNGTKATLKTEGGMTVICFSNTFGKNDLFLKLKNGTKAKFFGQLVVSANRSKELYLMSGLVSQPR